MGKIPPFQKTDPRGVDSVLTPLLALTPEFQTNGFQNLRFPETADRGVSHSPGAVFRERYRQISDSTRDDRSSRNFALTIK
jgi:hypothetical protein